MIKEKKRKERRVKTTELGWRANITKKPSEVFKIFFKKKKEKEKDYQLGGRFKRKK